MLWKKTASMLLVQCVGRTMLEITDAVPLGTIG